jgi:hypothetical protein
MHLGILRRRPFQGHIGYSQPDMGVLIRADTDRIRRTAFSLFFILLLAADSGMAGQDATSGEESTAKLIKTALNPIRLTVQLCFPEKIIYDD